MSRALPWAFGLALLAALVAFLPLRIALAAVGAGRWGLSAAAVEGSAWRGRLREARFGGAAVGDLDLRLDPVSTLTGAPRLAVEAPGDGAVSGRAALRLGPAGLAVEDATGSVALPLFRSALQSPVVLTVDGLSVRFRDGACEAAEGQAATDVLQRTTALLGEAGPRLAGDVQCRDGALLLPLEGQARRARVSVLLRVFGDGRYAAETRVATADPDLAASLRLAGFAPSGDAFALSDEGRLAP